MITFKEQFDKLTIAYINNEVRPYHACSCFVGNLLNGNHRWSWARGLSFGTITQITKRYEDAQVEIIKECEGLYTVKELIYLESIFMDNIKYVKVNSPEYEGDLFKAFERTLDELKKIHISKGEKIDEEFTFKKRELQSINI